MLKCRDVPVEVSAALDGELPWRRRLALRFHVLLCRHCRRYLRQARSLARAWRNREDPATDKEVAAVLDACRHDQEPGDAQER